MSKLRELVRKELDKILKEELDVPSNDGTSNGASEEDKAKAKKATQDGDDVKFVKPGELEENTDKEPSEESGMLPIKEEEVAPKVKEVFAALQSLAEDASALEEFADKDGDNKMRKLSEKLAKHLQGATQLVSEMREARDAILQEDAVKADEFGDKVIKALSKYCKDEKSGKTIKEKYMPFIAKAHKKGKKPAEVAERIKNHRFEM